VDQDLFTTLQLHGQESPEFCQQVRTTYPHLRLMKAFRIRDAADLAAIAPYETVVDRVLLDAYHPHVLGGTGQTLDWGALSAFRPRCPWVLAGGLTPDNVATALGQLTPDGIDLSSGVESAPGRKDLSQVARLFGAIAAATAAHPQEPSVGK
jgi:phosphoribosylanthranilate isomerase